MCMHDGAGTQTSLKKLLIFSLTTRFKGREKAAEEESAFQKQLKDAKAAQAQQDENRSSDSNGQGRSVDVESECDYSDANENVLKGNFKAMVRVSLD